MESAHGHSVLRRVREPAAAGTFYPEGPDRLRRVVESLLATWPTGADRGAPKALIVPHAGYKYSGNVAASGYASLRAASEAIQRVVVIGTAHSRLDGVATTPARGFRTPLGTVAIDHDAGALIAPLPFVIDDEDAHAGDHAIEVQLPFLQTVLREGFSLVPLLVGRTEAESVAEVLERLWGGPETLIIVSSDLSHYHDDATARRLDEATAAAIVGLRHDGLDNRGACGYRAIQGLLIAARRHRLRAELLALRNSGEVTGDRGRVVGYGAFRLG